ncbi:MAG TPA: FAD-binding oxidoreductase [Myxococcales bacterium]|nr:FAD-binding oxidoreductase [Myxococcales bacterium]
MSAPAPLSASSLPPPSALAQAAAAELEKLLPGRVSASDEDRLCYARDMWPKAILWIRQGRIPPPPDVVVWPGSEEEVAKVILLARAHKLPVIPFGAGSGVCGGVCAVHGGISLDLKRLERVGPVDGDHFTVDVDAGVIGEVLERKLNAQGYTLGHFPSSIFMSTLGGWLAARSAGQLSTRYGKIEDLVCSVRAVTGRGEVLQTPDRPSPGPDLAELLMGSEGTLCAFTRARLRVHPVPQHRAFRAFRFRSVEAGVDAIRRLMRDGLRPAVVRLYDPFDTALVARKKPVAPEEVVPPSERGLVKGELLPFLTRAIAPRALGNARLLNRAADLFRNCLLVLMFEGEARRALQEESGARELCQQAGGADLGDEPAVRWYQTRYDVSFQMSPVVNAGMLADTMEVAATWDRVLDVYHRVREATAPIAFAMCHFSHAYLEGCSLYFSFALAGRGQPSLESRYDELWKAGLSAALAAGATVSHHHGVGLLKARALAEQLGDSRRMLHGLKRALDPDGIMNPGKLLP